MVPDQELDRVIRLTWTIVIEPLLNCTSYATLTGHLLQTTQPTSEILNPVYPLITRFHVE